MTIREGRLTTIRRRVAVVVLTALLASMAVPLPLDAASNITLTDAIAPGRFAGQLGLGSGPVAVPGGSDVTFVATVSPPFPGESVGIWTRTAGGVWRLARSARISAAGVARTYLTVSATVTIQARLASTSGHAAAASAGRTATVDANGRSVIRVSCSDVAALASGSVAARSAGVQIGTTVRVEACRSGGRWSVGDVDPKSIAVQSLAGPAAATDDFDLTILRAGSRTVRLVQHGTKAGQPPIRSVLIVLAMEPLPLRVTRNVALTPAVPCGPHGSCRVQADVFAPATGHAWPVVVLLRGGPGGLGARMGLEALAARLAADGLVVFNADYRDNPASGGKFPRAFDDVACTVRVARATAARYGGSGGSVTMIGHSLGAYVGSIVSLSADAFASSCSATGQGAPDTFIGISGPYLLTPPNLQGNFADVLGGSRAEVPDAWRNGDPLAWVGRRPGVRFRLIHGAADPTVDIAASDALQTALASAGFDTSQTTVAGGTHVSVISDAKGGEWTLAVILAAIR